MVVVVRVLTRVSDERREREEGSRVRGTEEGKVDAEEMRTKESQYGLLRKE